MDIRVNDLGARIDKHNILHSIGCTSILLEWMDDNIPVYRMLLDCGMKMTRTPENIEIIDETNLVRIKNIMDNKVIGYESGIQAMALSHCHEDHVGGYPWFYQYCKEAITKDEKGEIKKNEKGDIIKGIPKNGIPFIYTTDLTRAQFIPFQEDLYELFMLPSKNMGDKYHWDKGIIKEVANRMRPAFYNSSVYVVEPEPPHGFDIILKFLPAGHTLGSAMIEIDTWKNGKSLGKILYTGDVCFRHGSFLVDPAKKDNGTYKAIILEGTYLRYKPTFIPEMEKYKKLQRKELTNLLKDKIIDTFSKKGNVILLVYGIDRTTNIMVCLRDILDYSGLKFPVYLDTSIGKTMTNVYLNFFERFTKYDTMLDEVQYFAEFNRNRWENNGLTLLQLHDKSYMYDPVASSAHRTDIIEKHREGCCVVLATSATLNGGTAIQGGSYMHPDGWGSDKKNLFLIVGSAIPGTDAYKYVKEYEKRKYADIKYQYWNRDEKMSYFEEAKFSASLEEFSQFSAHAQYEELINFINSNPNCRKFIFTHLGGEEHVETTIHYINDTVMSGVPSKYRRGSKMELRGDNFVLTGDVPLPLINLDKESSILYLDETSLAKFKFLTTKEKKTWNDLNGINFLNKLMSEYEQRKMKT